MKLKMAFFWICIVLFSVFCVLVYSVGPYYKDPSLCPAAYMSQNCLSNQYSCGYFNSVLYCDTPANMNSRIPASSTTTSAVYDASLGGGYVLDCLANSAACNQPTSWLCNQNSTCNTGNRATRCLASSTQSNCDVCQGGYTSCDASGSWVALDNQGSVQCTRQTNNFAVSPCGNATFGAGNSAWHTDYLSTTSCTCGCDANYLDCDHALNGGDSVNGCEVQKGVTQRPNWATNHTLYGNTCAQFVCSSGYIDFNGASHDGSDTDGCEITVGEACMSFTSIPGTCNISTSPATGTALSSGKNCTCIVTPPVNFQTSVLAQYTSPITLLWGQQNGAGALMNLTNNLTNQGFIITNTSWVGIGGNPTAKLDVKGNASINNSFYVVSNGYVGIGTSNPSQLLHVQGNANITGTLFVGYMNVTQGTSYSGDLDMQTHLILNIGNANTDFTNTGGLNLAGDLAVDSNVLYVNTTSNNIGIGTSNPNNKLELQGGNVSLNNTLYVSSSGFVGINISNPTSMLEVRGDLNVTGNAYLSNVQISSDLLSLNLIKSKDGNITFQNSTGSNMIKILPNGYFGIGNMVPSQPLYVQGNANITGTLYAGSINAGATNYSGNIDMNNNLILHIGNANTNFTSTGGLNLAGDLAVNSNVLYVNTTSNNVGIGTANPNNKLELRGGNVSLNNTLYVSSNGFVGINISNPNQPLQVQGNANVTGTLYAGSINTGATSHSGNIDMNNNLILHIGNANTNFTSTGGLNLAGDLAVNSNVLYVNTTSNFVGINITNPNQPLQVRGNANITGTVYAGSIVAGSTSYTGDIDMQTHIISNIGNAGTDFLNNGGLVLANSFNVTTGGAYINGGLNVSGGINNINGGIINAGNIGLGTGTTINAGANIILDANGAGTISTEASDTFLVGGGYGSTGLTLYPNGNLSMNGNLVVDGNANFASGSYINIGTDVNLYRGAANRLQTDDSLYVGSDLYVIGNLYLQGNLTTYNVATLNVNGSLLPSISAVFDVGSSAKQWRNGNFSGTINANNVYATTFYGSLQGSADMVDNHHVISTVDNALVKHLGANLTDSGVLDTSTATAVIIDSKQNMNVTSNVTIGGNNIKDSTGATRITVGSNVIIKIG